MSEFTQNKTAGVFATVLIGLIILTFMFTGYQQFEGGGSVANIGSVNGMPITPEEYQTEYNRQIEFYRQIMGGDLTAKQIENMKVKESIIKNIVQRKLMSKLAKDLGTFPADEEVKTEIKTLPYFQTNGQFDITRYKGLLAANKLTPLEFEKDVIEQIRLKKSQELTSNYPISKSYLADLATFKKDKLNAEIVQITIPCRVKIRGLIWLYFREYSGLNIPVLQRQQLAQRIEPAVDKIADKNSYSKSNNLVLTYR